MSKSDKRPYGILDANFCEWTASEKWSVINEISNDIFMKIASDSPVADLVQISAKWMAATTYKQFTTITEARRIQYYTSQKRKSDKRPIKEIFNEIQLKIVSGSPMVDLVQISTEWIVANRYKQSTTMIAARSGRFGANF